MFVYVCVLPPCALCERVCVCEFAWVCERGCECVFVSMRVRWGWGSTFYLRVRACA